MINIAELLKDAPKGMKLYSPLFGEVFLYTILSDSKFITVRTADSITTFNKFGQWGDNSRLKRFPDAECLLFPSKDCRTWEEWKINIYQFKVLDWLVHNNGSSDVPVQIYGLKKDRYLVTNILGSKGELMINKQDEWRLWTISDAKDGDVLACSDWLFILKQFNVKGNQHKTYCHYDLTLNRFKDDTDSYMVSGSDEFHPATKEQRDLLFTKMQEAGYQWDAEKKELKKIFKPKFKAGDEIKTGNTIETIAEVDYSTRSYSCESGRTIWFENQDLWHLAPKSHYDISNFHAGMPVLVRETSLNAWEYVLFSHCYIGSDGLTRFNAGLVGFTQCIPFNKDTEHLLGTTNMPDEYYVNW